MKLEYTVGGIPVLTFIPREYLMQPPISMFLRVRRNPEKNHMNTGSLKSNLENLEL